MLFNDEECENIETALLEMLPHGSGINCDWRFWWLKNNSLVCSNSYHCMNEHGYYDGYADFSIKISPLKSLHSFKLQFHGKTAHAKNKQYQLREYLEDTICYALPDNKSLFSLK